MFTSKKSRRNVRRERTFDGILLDCIGYCDHVDRVVHKPLAPFLAFLLLSFIGIILVFFALFKTSNKVFRPNKTGDNTFREQRKTFVQIHSGRVHALLNRTLTEPP